MGKSALTIDGRIVSRSVSGLLDTEYALFSHGDIELGSHFVGEVREFGYCTSVGEARLRLARSGYDVGLARRAAEICRGDGAGSIADAFARGPVVRRLAQELLASQLFDGDQLNDPTSDGTRAGEERLYEGFYLDLPALSRAMDLPGTATFFQGLYLAALLAESDEEGTLQLGTEAFMRERPPAERSLRKIRFPDPEAMLAALSDVARQARRQSDRVRDRSPSRAKVVARIAEHAGHLTDALARETLRRQEESLLVERAPDRGPLAPLELFRIDRVLSGAADGAVATRLEEATSLLNSYEGTHGRSPAVQYLRDRISLIGKREPAKAIAERASNAALAADGQGTEFTLLAAEAWEAAGQPARALVFAREVIADPLVSEHAHERACRILDLFEFATTSGLHRFTNSEATAPPPPLGSSGPPAPSERPSTLPPFAAFDSGSLPAMPGTPPAEPELPPSLRSAPTQDGRRPSQDRPAATPTTIPPDETEELELEEAPPSLPPQRRAAPPLPARAVATPAAPPVAPSFRNAPTPPARPSAPPAPKKTPVGGIEAPRPPAVNPLPPMRELAPTLHGDAFDMEPPSDRPSTVPTAPPQEAASGAPYLPVAALAPQALPSNLGLAAPRPASLPPLAATPPNRPATMPPAAPSPRKSTVPPASTYTRPTPPSGTTAEMSQHAAAVPSDSPKPTLSSADLMDAAAEAIRLAEIARHQPPEASEFLSNPTDDGWSDDIGVPVQSAVAPPVAPAPAPPAEPPVDPLHVPTRIPTLTPPSYATGMEPVPEAAGAEVPPELPVTGASLAPPRVPSFAPPAVEGAVPDFVVPRALATPVARISVAPRRATPQSFPPPVGDETRFMRGASLPPMAVISEQEVPFAPTTSRGEPEDAISLKPPFPGALPYAASEGPPRNGNDARRYFTALTVELARDYQTHYGLFLRTNVDGLELVQRRISEILTAGEVKTVGEAREVRRHGAFLSEVLARNLGAYWENIDHPDLGHWSMIVPARIRVWPFGRIVRFVKLGTRERDLVSFYLELMARSR